MFKLLIWGTGRRAEDYMKNRFFEGNHILGFIDSSCEKKEFHGYPVLDSGKACSMAEEIEYVVIVTMHYEEIYEKLIKSKVPRDKIIFTDCIDEPPYINDMETVRKISSKLYDRMMIQSSKRMLGMNEKDKTDAGRVLGTPDFPGDQYMPDYFRYRSFEFMAEEIQESVPEGDIAELGVFRGVFARLINEKFRDRRFFLFDSFEGFQEEEVENEIQLGRCDRAFRDRYRQTTEEAVLEKMPHPEKCIVLKGMFPDSVTEEAKKSSFAFVSLDVDLEESTYQGLCFFYPRLLSGGVIYVHDYNSSHLFGVRNAVKRYEDGQNLRLKKVPLADQCGTLVIIK